MTLPNNEGNRKMGSKWTYCILGIFIIFFLSERMVLANDDSIDNSTNFNVADNKEVVKELAGNLVIGTGYQQCLGLIEKDCKSTASQLKEVPIELQDVAENQMLDECIMKLVGNCNFKFKILVLPNLGECYNICATTRHTDIIHCMSTFQRFSDSWSNCRNEAVNLSQRCYQSCSGQFLPISKDDKPITTDPMGVGIDDQKLMLIKQLLKTPLPHDNNW